MTTGGTPGPQSPPNRRERLRKKLIQRPLVVALPALIIGIIIASFSATAFSEPNLADKPSGGIEVTITGNSGRPVGIAIDNSGDSIYYEVLFPSEDAGKRYSIILAGTAKLDTVDGKKGPKPPPSRHEDCIDVVLDNTLAKCQIFTGTIVKDPEPYTFNNGCHDLPTDDYYDAVSILGTTQVENERDWAYSTVSYPDIQTGDQEFNPSIQIGDGSGPENTGVAAADTCETMAGPSRYDEFVSSIPDPTGYSGNEHQWENTDAQNDNAIYVGAIYKFSKAEMLANIGIVLAGLAFAVTTGFAPLAFQAWLENTEPTQAEASAPNRPAKPAHRPRKWAGPKIHSRFPNPPGRPRRKPQ